MTGGARGRAPRGAAELVRRDERKLREMVRERVKDRLVGCIGKTVTPNLLMIIEAEIVAEVLNLADDHGLQPREVKP